MSPTNTQTVGYTWTALSGSELNTRCVSHTKTHVRCKSKVNPLHPLLDGLAERLVQKFGTSFAETEEIAFSIRVPKVRAKFSTGLYFQDSWHDCHT